MTQSTQQTAAAQQTAATQQRPGVRNLVFEIGTEEMPSLPLYKATEQMQRLVEEGLAASGLVAQGVKCASSPRRLTTYITGLAEMTAPVHQRLRGPAAAIAFDAQGQPTKAALGFARSKGVDPSALERASEDGKEYVFAVIDKPAEPVAPIVAELLSSCAAKLSWPRSQRWDSSQHRFARPVRWLLCLFGQDVVPVEFCGLSAGRSSRGHRLLAPEAVEVFSADEYTATLERVFVIVDARQRAQRIRADIAQLGQQMGLTADLPQHTFDDVVNLVEWPTVIMADFDEDFLKVPHEIICESMLKNQRYFPLRSADGALTQHFVVVSNGDPARSAEIARGNERVVRARLADAKFFYEEDLKHPLDYYLPRLDSVGFQEKLGTVAQKCARVEQLAGSIACNSTELSGYAGLARRAAQLCKADLVTGAVVEFTSQQGVMGGYYARAAGEPEEVAAAIAEHYRPRFAGDALPESPVGRIVALADKLDTVCGIFAIGQAPTGSSDPFQVRRSAIGIINIIRAEPSVDLGAAIDVALDSLEQQGLSFDRQDVRAQVRSFFVGRLATIAREEGIAPDTIEALSSVDIIEPVEFLNRAHALQSARDHEPELFEDLAGAYTRADHLRDASLAGVPSLEAASSYETELAQAINSAQTQVAAALEEHDYGRALQALAALRPTIDAFFDNVVVMDDDPAVRSNRLLLLNAFVQAFNNVADISKIQKRGGEA